MVARALGELMGKKEQEADDEGQKAMLNASQMQFNLKAIEQQSDRIKETVAQAAFHRDQDLARQKALCKATTRETLDKLKQGNYEAPSGETRHIKEQLEFAVKFSRIYKDAGSNEAKAARYPHTLIELCPQSCVSAAYRLTLKGETPIMLNFANGNDAGGSYLEDIGVDEEELFRCTGLALVLDKKQGSQDKDFYPLRDDNHAGRVGGIYSPHVPLIRRGKEREYQFLEKPAFIGVATVEACQKPQLDMGDKSNPRLQGDDLNWTRERMRTFCKMAYENGHSSLVIGAMASNNFGNPPKHIAQLMMEIAENEYKGCFKNIIFAVADEHLPGANHNPEGNFMAVARVVKDHKGLVYGSNGEEIKTL